MLLSVSVSSYFSVALEGFVGNLKQFFQVHIHEDGENACDSFFHIVSCQLLCLVELVILEQSLPIELPFIHRCHSCSLQ